MRAAPTVLLALAILAGCVTPAVTPPESDGTPSPPAPPRLAWGFSGCRMVVAVIPVASGALAPHLPEGFRALSPAEVGLPPDPRGDATLAIEALRCESGLGLHAPATDVPYASVFTFVEAPETLADSAVDFHSFIKWDVLVADAPLRDELAAAGVPAVDGRVEFADLAGDAFTVGIALDGSEYAIEAAAFAPPAPTGGTFAEYTPTPNGLAKWRATALAPASQSAGFITIPDGTLASDIAGAGRAPAYLLGMRDIDFTNATLELPVATS